MFGPCKLLVLTYSCENFAIKKEITTKLQIAQISMALYNLEKIRRDRTQLKGWHKIQVTDVVQRGGNRQGTQQEEHTTNGLL